MRTSKREPEDEVTFFFLIKLGGNLDLYRNMKLPKETLLTPHDTLIKGLSTWDADSLPGGN